MTDDPALLRRFVTQHCQTSFAELVQRHLGLVYHSALRQTEGDTLLAEDAAQATFLLVAEKAATLCAHPELAGWLYTTACHKARELRRGEARRHRREQTVSTMNETHGEPTNDEAWNRVRPLIDDAMLELLPEDRVAVLLRYFEGRTYSDVGAALKLGENAARMRVDRALERLQGALAQRGVTSTGAALAAVLAVPAALAAPAGLAGKITGGILAGGVAAGTGVSMLSFFFLMTSSKIIAVVAGIAAAAGIGSAVFLDSELRPARAAAVSDRAQQSMLETKVRELESRLGVAQVRLAELDAAEQRRKVEVVQALRTPPAPVAEPPITQAVVEARLERARASAQAGRSAEALQDYLWCFDTGMPRVSDYRGVRVSFLLSNIAELGKTYPPALEALRERRDAAERRVVSDAADREALKDYCALNRELGETDRSLVVFDSLPANDRRRGEIVYDVREQLVEARRYAELVQARPYATMLRHFESISDTSQMKKVNFSESRIAWLRGSVARRFAKEIEALAGAGELEHAREYVAKVIALDASAETRTLLETHLARAGHPELSAP